MSETNSPSVDSKSGAQSTDLDRRLNAAGAGLLLIWIGIVLLASLGWALGLIGVGLVLLGEQLVRWFTNTKFEALWVGAGFFVLLGGLIVAFDLGSILMPGVLIAVGVTFLVSAFRRRGDRE